MSSPENEDESARILLQQKGIHFESITDLLKLVHPLCQDCHRPCLTNGGKCPFEFSRSQIELDEQLDVV